MVRCGSMRNVALFHDYVVYSPLSGSYCSVRLVMERTAGNVWTKHMSVGVLQLRTFPHNYRSLMKLSLCLSGSAFKFSACFLSGRVFKFKACVLRLSVAVRRLGLVQPELHYCGR